MAKKAKVVKNLKRQIISERYRDKRIQLKKIINNPNSSIQEKIEARIKIEKMPRDSNPNRVRNRCNATGRPRGYYRRFGLSRITLREFVNNGLVPGVRKASW